MAKLKVRKKATKNYPCGNCKVKTKTNNYLINKAFAFGTEKFIEGARN